MMDRQHASRQDIKKLQITTKDVGDRAKWRGRIHVVHLSWGHNSL